MAVDATTSPTRAAFDQESSSLCLRKVFSAFGRTERRLFSFSRRKSSQSVECNGANRWLCSPFGSPGSIDVSGWIGGLGYWCNLCPIKDVSCLHQDHLECLLGRDARPKVKGNSVSGVACTQIRLLHYTRTAHPEKPMHMSHERSGESFPKGPGQC